MKLGMVKEARSIGIPREEQRDHVDPFSRRLVGKDMGKVGPDGKKVSGCELPETITDEESSLPQDDEAQLYLFVLVQFGVEVLRPVLLDDQCGMVGLGDDKGQNFHYLIRALDFKNTLKITYIKINIIKIG